jgi:hypothetical protein
MHKIYTNNIMPHHHSHHKYRSHYSFKNFVHDVEKPFMKVEKDVVGVYHHGISALEKVGSKLGSSLSLPLIIIGGAVVVYVIATNKR